MVLKKEKWKEKKAKLILYSSSSVTRVRVLLLGYEDYISLFPDCLSCKGSHVASLRGQSQTTCSASPSFLQGPEWAWDFFKKHSHNLPRLCPQESFDNLRQQFLEKSLCSDLQPLAPALYAQMERSLVLTFSTWIWKNKLGPHLLAGSL